MGLWWALRSIADLGGHDPYHVTCHAKHVDAAEGLSADLRPECHRRGPPEPPDSHSELQLGDLRNLIPSVTTIDWPYVDPWAAELTVSMLLDVRT